MTSFGELKPTDVPNGEGQLGTGSTSLSLGERTVADSGVDSGEIRMPRELLRRLGIQEGDTVRVEYGERTTLLRAMAGSAPWAESNPEDLAGIGARSGTRLCYTVGKMFQRR